MQKVCNDIEVQILEAEGQLNRRVHSSLQKFREKLNGHLFDKINRTGRQDTYDISKEGPEKQFKFRQSLLSIMFKIQDFKTIYNMVVASFAILTFNLVYDAYVTTGKFLDTTQFTAVFKGGQRIFLAWWMITLTHFSVIPLTMISVNYYKFPVIWIPLYLFHQVLIMWLAIDVTKQHELGFASCVIILVEATRMVMKSHSYFRTKMLYCTPNQYKYFQLKGIGVNKDTKQQGKSLKIHIHMGNVFTQFKRLSYFFVAPTLIYRDQYTLTAIRRPHMIIVHFINFVFCIYYAYLLYTMQVKPVIRNLEKKLDFATIVTTIMRIMLPSVLFLVLGFFGFLHSWLNAWSQITRFSDRAFYSDWWNSFEFGSYYRKWNILVHDFLYFYIYIDFCRFFKICKKNKMIPKLATFLISAVFHELIICFSIGFFYPILFVLFTGPGIILIQNQSKLKKISINLMFWIQMYIGTAMLFAFYLVEVFARKKISDQLIISEWGNAAPLVPRTLYLGHTFDFQKIIG